MDYQTTLFKNLDKARRDQMTAHNVSARRHAETVERRALAALQLLSQGASVEQAHKTFLGVA